jgi:hypothetical protein
MTRVYLEITFGKYSNYFLLRNARDFGGMAA